MQLHISKQVYWFAKTIKDNSRMISEPLAWLQQLDDNMLPKGLALGKVHDITDWLGNVLIGYVQAL